MRVPLVARQSSAVVPDAMWAMLGAPNRAAALRAFTAMLSMTKLDIAQLEQAFSCA